jgi:nicotinamide-nucleotide adenylyltransferase
MIEDQGRHLQAGEMWTSAMLQELQFFTLPNHDLKDEQSNLSRFGIENQPTKPVGMVIGRFQPLHYGHLYLMKMALAVSEKIIIGIGSANITDKDNPFPVSYRGRMVREALKREGMMSRVLKIVHLNDYEDDQRWLNETLAHAGSIDLVVGNNEWVNGVFENAGLMALRVPLLERGTYEGKKIRAKLRNQGKLPKSL